MVISTAFAAAGYNGPCVVDLPASSTARIGVPHRGRLACEFSNRGRDGRRRSHGLSIEALRQHLHEIFRGGGWQPEVWWHVGCIGQSAQSGLWG